MGIFTLILMGSILISQCKCGYEADDLYQAGGMMDFHNRCKTPCYCDNCEIVFSRNKLTKEAKKGWIRCPKCRRKVKYYGDIVEDFTDYDKEYVME